MMKNMKLALLAMSLMASSFGMAKNTQSLTDTVKRGEFVAGAIVAYCVGIVVVDLVGVSAAPLVITAALPGYNIIKRQRADDKFRENIQNGLGYEPEIKEFNKQRAFERDLFDAEGF